eukprot:631222-Heterocapsa_arctica.AAC.1
MRVAGRLRGRLCLSGGRRGRHKVLRHCWRQRAWLDCGSMPSVNGQRVDASRHAIDCSWGSSFGAFTAAGSCCEVR